MAYENLYTGNKIEIKMKHLYTVSSNATFLISVEVPYFMGVEGFCLYTPEIDRILLKISELLDLCSGQLTINDTESDSFLELKFEDNRTVTVSGQFGGSYNDNFFRFKFEADYTIFWGLRESLKKY